MKLRILITAMTSAPMLEAQVDAIKRWIPGPLEIFVVNDAPQDDSFRNLWNGHVVEEIRDVARKLDIPCFRFPQWRHTQRLSVFPDEPHEYCDLETANTRCADAIQWGVNLVLWSEADPPLLILDADMIPYAPFKWGTMLKEKPIWGYPQGRITHDGRRLEYLWNGLLLVNPAECERMDLFNVDCGNIDGAPLDVGGMLYRFLDANPGKTGTFYRRFGERWVHQNDTTNGMPEKVVEFINWDSRFSANYGRQAETYNDCFLHLGAGGNWELRGQAHMTERIKRFVAAVS